MHWSHYNIRSQEEATKFAIEHLTLLGYKIQEPECLMGFETPDQLCKRRGFTSTHLWRRLKDPECPPFESRNGPSGRIIVLRSNQALESFLSFRPGSKKTSSSI